MRPQALLCVVAGHRWAEDPEAFETYPVLLCGRCGRHQKLAVGSSGPEGWAERRGPGRRPGGFIDRPPRR